MNAADGAYWLDRFGSGAGVYVPIGANLLTNGSFETATGGLATSYGYASASMPLASQRRVVRAVYMGRAASSQPV